MKVELFEGLREQRGKGGKEDLLQRSSVFIERNDKFIPAL